ncbi:MAG TPA: hypothetical protein VHO91_02195 [Rhodopila sp.]|nr:hypothetical protein [Rhodopila sp.]
MRAALSQDEAHGAACGYVEAIAAFAAGELDEAELQHRLSLLLGGAGTITWTAPAASHLVAILGSALAQLAVSRGWELQHIASDLRRRPWSKAEAT